MPRSQDLRNALTFLFKFGISAAIIAWLLCDRQNREVFGTLSQGPKDWNMLFAAWLLSIVAVMLTFVRWYLLVRALDLSFTLKDAFRLGFLGYLLNFVSLGSVGGDLFKAVFVAREQPGQRAEAVATVVLDRVVGLYMLFVLATVAILFTGQLHSPTEQVRMLSQATLFCTALGAAGICVLLVPGFTHGTFSRFLERMPRTGPLFGKLLGAIRIYRSRLKVLAWAALLSVGVHSLSAAGIYLVACALPGARPTLGDHFVIVPLAMVTGVLPLPMNGLGAFETVVNSLYLWVGASAAVGEGRGLLVALGYRAITIIIAMIGACYYVASRREVARLLREAERELEENQPASADDEILPASELGASNC